MIPNWIPENDIAIILLLSWGVSQFFKKAVDPGKQKPFKFCNQRKNQNGNKWQKKPNVEKSYKKSTQK